MDKGTRVEDKSPTLFRFYSASLFPYGRGSTSFNEAGFEKRTTKRWQFATCNYKSPNGQKSQFFIKQNTPYTPLLYKKAMTSRKCATTKWYCITVACFIFVHYNVPYIRRRSPPPQSPVGHRESVVDQSNELMNPNGFKKMFPSSHFHSLPQSIYFSNLSC